MMQAVPFQRELVLVGGGHTHAIVLRKIGMQGLPVGVRLTLITNLVDTPYSGMLPCHISGLYSFEESHIDLRPLTRFAQGRLIMDEMIGLDPARQQIICRHHPPIHYDVLSMDIGSTPAAATVPGAQAYAIPAKPVPQLLTAWAAYLETIAEKTQATVGIVGGGVGGVELALNMQVRLWQAMGAQDRVTLHLFHRGQQLATGRNRWTQKRLKQLFQARQIQTHLGESVIALEPAPDEQTRVCCASGLEVACDRIFWVTQAAAPAWLKTTGLATDDQGFILVQDTLQSISHANIFAAGDIATQRQHPRPKAGVFAVRQGPPLYQNLCRYLQGQSLKPFRPQKQFLNLIDTGTGTAIASRGPFAGESRLFRHWKHWIDSRFMALFTTFPTQPMTRGREAAKTSTSLAYCAGCASKIGSSVLTQTLQRLQTDFPTGADWPHQDRIHTGLAAFEDAAIVQVPPGMLAVQTVDQFRAIVEDPYILGQICVHHCLSDLFAMGAEAQTVLAIATLPYATDEIQAETLYHLLAGAYQALGQTQTFLVGGHTTEGPELSLGFACNGWVAPDQILSKRGLQPGQALILTKPLGTGTLFAAEMQLAAKGRWVEAALAQMLISNRRAVACLRQHGVTACTDVTGFGLAGHLHEMVKAAKVAVELDLGALPVLAGAVETLAKGYYSSLHQRNQQITTQLQASPASQQHPSYPILFDPQTAGGLLATVPAEQASACLIALQQAGYTDSRQIGKVTVAQRDLAPIRIDVGAGFSRQEYFRKEYSRQE